MNMTLPDFIHDRLDDIVNEWAGAAQGFAQGGVAPARGAHARKLLRSIADEMRRRQAREAGASDKESSRPATRRPVASVLASEYGELRATVLRQWRATHPAPTSIDLDEVARFDAAMDEALAELLATIAPEQPRDLFLGVLNHELRSSIAAILMSAQVQVRRSAPASATAKAATRILKSCERLRESLDALSEYTDVNLGKPMTIEPKESDAGELCQEAADAFASAEHPRQIVVERRGDLRGIWDEARLLQALEGLLTNASRYASKDGQVTVTADGEAKHFVRVIVHSNGMPIDADSLLRIFDPISRLDDSKPTYAGLGLGLFIVREVVDAHLGRLKVEANSDRGTTFEVLLPRTSQGLPDSRSA